MCCMLLYIRANIYIYFFKSYLKLSSLLYLNTSVFLLRCVSFLLSLGFFGGLFFLYSSFFFALQSLVLQAMFTLIISLSSLLWFFVLCSGLVILVSWFSPCSVLIQFCLSSGILFELYSLCILFYISFVFCLVSICFQSLVQFPSVPVITPRYHQLSWSCPLASIHICFSSVAHLLSVYSSTVFIHMSSVHSVIFQFGIVSSPGFPC